MTFIVTFLVGLGGLLIASSLDCSSLKDTFLAIIHNQSIDWSGAKSCSTPQASANGSVDINPDGSCNPGFHRVMAPSGKAVCMPNVPASPSSGTGGVVQWPQGWAPRCNDGTCHCNPFAPVPTNLSDGTPACKPR